MSDRPKSATDLAAQIEELVRDGNTYETSADAMWKAALLAFNYAASEVGATGFQASWAALKFYGEAMHVKCPYSIIKAEDAVFPQYDILGRVRSLLENEWRPWIVEQAREHLAEYEASPTHTYTDDDGVEHASPTVVPRVVEHWRQLTGVRS